ncbi:TonB-dependent siderophore receptor [Leptolyngbyaceae cyanobacterium CCMR0082]|uniref:TonB-dependent siderophore receptor n=2 Tax=Adonisia turfae TaxID=2950184 RepID=A0A6M0SB83_9CYAN|nr:TonB-dependent siderophore receptor [Adonisia turfae]NEZ55845.1 TonB-dependent siderophore receptor [Adonisia turfae CCMR0081]NEZ65343.1 TonB-dependent siderophore receptor [Adonisia turfae CCMR0082]
MFNELRVFGIAAFTLLATMPPTMAEETLRIIVTAERTPEDVQDVPISITAITEQEVEDADITSLEDIARNTPNFTFFSSGDRSFGLYSIRGLSNSTAISNRDPVDFYVDGVPYNFASFIDFDLPDLERVEVLRGPQSVLYGRNSLAGVVNLITRKPTDTFEFSGVASYGNYNDLDLRASVSGPIIDDDLFFRLSGNYGSRDGYLRNTLLDDGVNEQSGGNGRGQLLWTPSDNLEIALNTSFNNYQDGANAYVILNTDDPFETEQDIDGFTDLVSNDQSLRVAYTHPDFRFTSITNRRFSKNDVEFDGDYTAADAFVVTIEELTNTIFSQELRLQSPETAERFEWILGGYYESNHTDSINNGLINGDDIATIFGPTFPLPPGSINVANAEVNSDTFAIFGQMSYRPIDALTLTTGLRYESTNSTLERFDRSIAIPGLPDMPFISLDEIEQNGDELLPRFAVEYRFSPDLMAYGSITRGYRPSGVNLGPGGEDSATFDAERSWNYEVGLKSSWLDDRLAVNLALFHTPVDDFQILQFDLIGNSFTDNADVSITGFELEARATPVPGFDIIAGLGLTDAEFTNFTNPFTGDDAEGNNLQFSPDVTYNLALQYRSPQGLFGRLELQGLGTTFFDDANTIKQEPYAIFNARLGYEFDNTGIYLFGNNIFDQEYINQAFAFPPFGTLASYGMPANYGVQVRTQF